MALVALHALMLGSFAGLLIGRWSAALPLAAAIPAAALLAGPELGAVGLLGAAGVWRPGGSSSSRGRPECGARNATDMNQGLAAGEAAAIRSRARWVTKSVEYTPGWVRSTPFSSTV